MKFLYSSFLCLLVSTSFLQSANPDQQKQKQPECYQMIMMTLCYMTCVGFYGFLISLRCCEASGLFVDDDACWRMGMDTQSVKRNCQVGYNFEVAGAISAFVVVASMIVKKKCCKGNKSFD